jgi:hypothetical protein
MPRLEFEPTIQVFELAKTVCASDRAATSKCINILIYILHATQSLSFGHTNVAAGSPTSANIHKSIFG